MGGRRKGYPAPVSYEKEPKGAHSKIDLQTAATESRFLGNLIQYIFPSELYLRSTDHLPDFLTGVLKMGGREGKRSCEVAIQQVLSL